MATNDNVTIGDIVKRFIDRMISAQYTESNMYRLADAISSNCSISTAVLCFDCIQTLPSQSEIHIKLSSSGSMIEKVIDISYNTNNKMVVQNVH